MKKILALAVAFCAAATMQAASIAWGGEVWNSQSTVEDQPIAAGSTIYLIYLGTTAPAGEVTSFDPDSGLTNLGGTLMQQDTITQDQADAFTYAGGYSRPDSFGGVNGYWMIVTYDPTTTKEYAGYYIGQISGITDTTSAGMLKSENGYTEGEGLDAGAYKVVSVTPDVPEPATAALALAGLAMLFRRRRA